MFSSFDHSTKPKNYLPDSIYMTCGKDKNCDVCLNVVWSPVVNGLVHDTLAGKVFCPFGKKETLNERTYSDQAYINNLNKYVPTTWGRVPQLDPRPLARIGLEFRTS